MKVKRSAVPDEWKSYFNQTQIYPSVLGVTGAAWRWSSHLPEGPGEGLLLLAFGNSNDEALAALFFPAVFIRRFAAEGVLKGEFREIWQEFWKNLSKLGFFEVSFTQALPLKSTDCEIQQSALASHRSWAWVSGRFGQFRLSFTQNSQRILRRALFGRVFTPVLPTDLGATPLLRPFYDPLASALMPPFLDHPEFLFWSLPLSYRRALPPALMEAQASHWQLSCEDTSTSLFLTLCFPSGKAPGLGLQNIALHCAKKRLADAGLRLPGALVWRRFETVPICDHWLQVDLTIRPKDSSPLVLNAYWGINHRSLSTAFNQLAGSGDLWQNAKQALTPMPADLLAPGALTLAGFLTCLGEADYESFVRELALFSAASAGPLMRLFYWKEPRPEKAGAYKISRDPWFQAQRLEGHFLRGKHSQDLRVRGLCDHQGFVDLQTAAFDHCQNELASGRLELSDFASAQLHRLWTLPCLLQKQVLAQELARPELLAAAVTLERLQSERLFFALSDEELALVLLDSNESRWRRFVSARREARIRDQLEVSRIQRAQNQLPLDFLLRARQKFIRLLQFNLTPERQKELGLAEYEV